MISALPAEVGKEGVMGKLMRAGTSVIIFLSLTGGMVQAAGPAPSENFNALQEAVNQVNQNTVLAQHVRSALELIRSNPKAKSPYHDLNLDDALSVDDMENAVYIGVAQSLGGSSHFDPYADSGYGGISQSYISQGYYAAGDMAVTGNTLLNGNVTANSDVNVGGRVSANGLNLNNNRATGLADGRMAPGSTDAVTGGQLYSARKELNHRIDGLDRHINRVGAGAAALANLHPLPFDSDYKFSVAAAYGHYKNENAAALGMFYQPNADILFSISGTMGMGDPMLGAGMTYRFGAGEHFSKADVMVRLKAAEDKIQALTELVGQLQEEIDKCSG